MHSFMAADYRIGKMMRSLAVLLLMCGTVCGTAWAQPWPAKPVKMIVPFDAGGTADTLGRLMAQKLGEQLKASFVVENRPGAGGALGSELGADRGPSGSAFPSC